MRQWLDELGLGQYIQAFNENTVGFDVLHLLSDDDLKELGLSLGDRRRFQAAVEARKGDLLPEEISDVKKTGELQAEPELRQLTVLFCDLVNSTSLAAKLNPEDVREILLNYQNACSKVISHYDGFVAKFMGDGVYSYFGYPVAHEDDAERAINAGLEIVESIKAISPRFGDLPKLEVRVGIATGSVAVGDLIGDSTSERANVTGEAPNLAARLQAIAEPNTIVIGETTHSLAGGMFETAGLGKQILKGFPEPMAAWIVYSLRVSESRFQALRGRHLTKLVAREEEIEIVLRRWRRAREGEGQVVLISGEPGIGKSRLVQAIQEEIINESHIRLSYQGSPYHINSILHPVIQQIERDAGLVASDSPVETLDKLESMIAKSVKEPDETLPLLASLLSIPTDGRYPSLDLSPQRQLKLTLDVLVDRLVKLAEQQPVLFVFEDCHWIDPTTLELLELVIERVPKASVLMLITYRPEFVAPWIGRPRVTPIVLGRLEFRDCQAMVDALAENFGIDKELRDRIANQTDGVPLFIEELTKTVLESNPGHTAAFEVPKTLQDSLESRLDRLGPAKEVAQIGAVFGREFSYELLSLVAQHPQATLKSNLEKLVSSGLVSIRGEPPNATYTFKHALVQDTAYGSLLRNRRIELHDRIADALKEIFSTILHNEPEILAHHYEEACRYDLAAKYWYEAGRNSFNRSAIKETIAHTSRGLQIVEKIEDLELHNERESALQATLALAFMASKGVAHYDTGQAIMRANALLRKREGSPHFFPVMFGLSHFHSWSGPIQVALEAANQMWKIAKSNGSSDQLLPAYNALGLANFHLGENTTALHHLEQSNAIYDADRHADLAFIYMVEFRVNGLLYRSFIQFALGFPDRAAKLSDEAVNLARARQPRNLSAALGFGGHVGVFRGDVHKCLERSEECIALCQEHGYLAQSACAKVINGWAIAQNQDYSRGINLITDGIEYFRSVGSATWLCCYLATLANVCLSAGCLDDASSAVEEGLKISKETGARQFCSLLYQIKGDISVESPNSNPHTIESTYRKSINIARSQSAKSWELRAATRLARLLHNQGKTTEARDTLAPKYNWFTEGFDTVDLKEARAQLDEMS